MEDSKSFIEPLLERIESYGKTSFELYRLRAIEKIASVASTIVSRGAFVIILSLFIIIISIGAALWLGDLFGKSYYGFFCVGGFYGIIGSIIYFMHNTIKKSVSDSIISEILN